MANIDYLHTGNSNIEPTFGNEEVAETNAEAISEQQQTLQALMPDVQFLRDYADREIAAIADIRSYIKELGDKPDKEMIALEYRARELYIGFLKRFKGDIDNQIALAESEAQK